MANTKRYRLSKLTVSPATFAEHGSPAKSHSSQASQTEGEVAAGVRGRGLDKGVGRRSHHVCIDSQQLKAVIAV